MQADELRAWMLSWVGSACGIDPEGIDPGARFNRYGLDSLRASRMVAELSARLGRPLSPTLVWEYPTIAALTSFLMGAPVASDAAGWTDHDVELEPIAIVGMACRFPRAPTVPAYWQLLMDGVDAIVDVPEDRGWDAWLRERGVTLQERSTIRRGGFLEHIDGFDPMFFGISPREAAAMDPQQRLALELAWEALEDGGLRPQALVDTPTGVFMGAIWSDYESVLYGAGIRGIDQFTVTGSHYSIIANRVSYVLGLQGPSLTVDSACSSGLVVVHLACESLRSGESTVALAGAVNLDLRPESALAVARFGALSPDGRCYTFDSRANGYVRGEGGGMVVLKTLSRALADGDPIHAVIRGSAVNNDGSSNGMTAPSRAAQEAVLTRAYRRAGVHPARVAFVEAHGTGTPLGDPIEARALGRVLGAGRSADAPLWVGSVKTNFGHLEGAAGIAGLIKVALALEHGAIPPSLNFATENPHAPLAELGLAVVTEARPWASSEPMIAGVSSFGLGGTNGHVVLEQWPGPVPERVASEKAEASVRIEGSSSPGVVFVFPGQGAQWLGMARTLLHEEPIVRATLVACDRHIRRWTGWSLLQELTATAARSRLDEIEVSLPAIISVDIAVASWWRSKGVVPAAVVGHSTGEIAAAHVAGILDLADTMQTICAYGRFVGRFSGRGGMAFIGLPWGACGEVLAEFDGPVFRAIQDSAEGTVVAAEPQVLARLLTWLSERKVFCRPVRMNVGPHSPLVDSVREELLEALRELRPQAASIPLISEVTGEEVDGRTLDAAHWVRNFGDPAYFSRAIDTLIDRGQRVFVDVGPHPITLHSVEANLRRAGGGTVIASLRRDEDGRATLLEAHERLVASGIAVGEASGGDDATDGRALLLPLSARSEAALQARAAELAATLRHDGGSLRDLLHTAATRRQALEHRAAAVGRGREALIEELSALARDPSLEGAARGRVRHERRAPLVLVFAGQGSQWVGMGQRLLAEEPVFRAEVERCDAVAREHASWSLVEELTRPEASSRLGATEIAQPALFAVQAGVAALLAAWGVRPDAVIGQSAGEVAAAHVAGALSRAEAVRVALLRGRVLQGAIGKGTMAWVALSREEAQDALLGREREVAIAAVNDPGSVLLSGGPALAEVLAELTAQGVVHRAMQVEYASHGPQMDPFAKEMIAVLGAVDARPTTLPIYSTVSGGRIAGEELTASYWARNVRQTVELARAVASCHADGHRLFVEVGPHPVVTASLSLCLAAAGSTGVAIATLRRGGDEPLDVRRALGTIWAHGGDVDLSALHPEGGRVVSLPPYPWQRERCWVDVKAPPPRAAGEHPLLGRPFGSALHPEERGWEQSALAEVGPWVTAHGFGEQAVVAGSTHLALVLAAGRELHGEGAFEVAELQFQRMMLLPAGALQVVAVEREGGAAVTIASRGPGDATRGEWMRHAAAELRPREATPGSAGASIAEVRARCPQLVDAAEHYTRLERAGVIYGDALRSVEAVFIGEREVLGRVSVPAGHRDDADLAAHPALLDGCLQVAMLQVLASTAVTSIPVVLEHARLHAAWPSSVWAHARIDGDRSDVVILDEDGRVLGELLGLRCAPLDGTFDPLARCAYRVAWRRHDRVARERDPGAPGRWVVLGDAGGTGSQVARALQERGEICVELAAERLAELPAALRAGCRGVVWCGSLDATPWADTTLDSLQTDLRRGLWGAIATTQAILGAGLRDSPRLFLLTRGAQAVDGGSAEPAQAPLWGMARTLFLEHPELECTRIDLSPEARHGEAASLVDELLAGAEETEVALRPAGRFVARMVEDRLEAATTQTPVLRPDATYLVTGGLGGLGLALAGWMVDNGARHVALVSRRSHDEARAELEALKARGAEIHVLLGDVAEPSEAQRIVDEIATRLPPLRGVVHAAAVIRDRTVSRIGEGDLWEPLRPKLLGAWNLHAVTRGWPLDFFVLYSSLTAVLGALGQAVYAAGNAGLDALAHARAAEGLPATSIQWGPHSDVGMTRALADQGARLTALGLESFTPAEGCALFGRVIQRPQVTLSLVRFSLRRWLETTPQVVGSPFLSELPQDEPERGGGEGTGVRARLAQAPAGERAVLLEEHVVAELGRVLRLPPEKIDRELPFSRLGLDSLMSLELRNRLERSLELRLLPTLCFTYPRASSLTEFLLGALGIHGEAEPAEGKDEDELLAAFDASLRSLDAEGLG